MRPEILAPAGSLDAMKAAVHAGADAVYLGGSKFGARAYASNFNEDSLIEAIEYCHLYGVKVYLTINTLFRNEEISELFDYLKPLYEAGLDAVIVQDIGVMRYVHTHFPDLPIHASTQMTITTKFAFELISEYGVTRIVPARELSISEIKELKNVQKKPEIEVFVQGALCYCYSGQCLMSSMLGGRSGNRGRCAQTCRLPYKLYDKDENLINTEGDYLLSPKDLCGLEAIPDLIEAGVDSFKIEGRMKRPEYVAVCVRAYRKLLDAWYEGRFTDNLVNKYKAEMAAVFNRGGFTNGYYHKKNGNDMMSLKNPANIGVEIGTIVAIVKNQIKIRLKQDIYKGDILSVDSLEEDITLTSNLDGSVGQDILLNAPKVQRLHKGQKIHRISEYPLMKELESYVLQESKIALKGSLQLIPGDCATFTLKANIKGDELICVYQGDPVEYASNKPLTEDIVRDKIEKTGTTRYVFEELSVQISEDAFYTLKALKELRRKAFSLLEKEILDKSRRIYMRNDEESICSEFGSSQITVNSEKSVVMVSKMEQYRIVKEYNCFEEIYLDMQFFDIELLKAILNEKEMQKIAIVLPPIFRMQYQNEMEEILMFIAKECSNVVVVVRNIDELSFLKQIAYDGKLVIDHSLYVMNDWAATFIRDVFRNARITIPVELNANQIKNLQYSQGNSEIEVYGYQQLMISTQCLQNTVKKCNKENPYFVMRDRYFKNFYVFSVCKYCYNIIYNGIPTIIYDILDKKIGMNNSKRLHFTKENADEVSLVVDAFIQEKLPECEKTRGHYKRGVE